MISVIVPVYNVEQYLDECIKSIVNQTYTDLEILLIDDGSTDNSGEICDLWAHKDRRIRVIHKENEGQAACRNLGLQEAKGEYVTFVDSDDWIANEMVEELLNAIESYDAEICICDANEELSGGKISGFSLQNLSEKIIDIQKNPEFILTVKYTMWAKLYKRDFLINKNIIEPSIKFEDFAVIPIILALANKVACVDKCLYFYRYRESSTIRNLQYIDDRFLAIEYMINSFRERGMFDDWKDIIQRIVTERGIVLMRQIYPILGRYYKTCYERYDEILKENFQTSLSNINSHFSSFCRTGKIDSNIFGKYNLAVIGSYNLMIVAKMIMKIGTPDFLENYYGFSNIISIMSKPPEKLHVLNLAHSNEFRQKNIIQDFSKKLIYKNKCEFIDIDYILVDFLEERFNTGIIENSNSYFTISDAFNEIAENIDINFKVLDMYSKQTLELWEESCNRFIQLLSDYIGLQNVVLVKNYLAEKIIDENGNLFDHDNISEIRKINQLLQYKYEYFEEHAPNIIVFETLNDDYYYTEKGFKHGCYPWHLNNREYCKIAVDLTLRLNYDMNSLQEVKKNKILIQRG